MPGNHIIMHFFAHALQKWPSNENINSRWLFMTREYDSPHSHLKLNFCYSEVMAESVVLLPPKIVEVEGRVLFLGGPIQNTWDWQTEAIDRIHTLDSDIIIASPRRDYLDETFVYDDQVDWESYFLRRAAKLGGIMFWLAKQTTANAGRSYAQTTRFELAEWKTHHQHYATNLVVGIEEGFSGARYIKRRLSQDCPHVPILDSLVETCAVSVELFS